MLPLTAFPKSINVFEAEEPQQAIMVEHSSQQVGAPVPAKLSREGFTM